MPSEARLCAQVVLRRVFERGAHAEKAFHAEARALDRRDRALAMRIAYGSVQRAGTLDYVIGRLSERPTERMDGAVLAGLRAGAYELLYSDGAPAHAVLADTVEIVKRSGSHGHGLVNAVLRRLAREGEALLAGLDESTPERAAIMHSHPQWLAQMWWRELGPEQARALMAADNDPAESAVRVNALRCRDPAELLAELPDSCPPEGVLGGVALPEALIMTKPFDLQGSQPWRRGAIIAQSRAAMLVARALDPQPGERVLDLCAAPGGKSTHIAALMGGEGEVRAVESHPARARALRETVRRMGAEGIVCVREEDALNAGRDGELFERVLLDPPCSGLGTLQARADLRWRATPERIAAVAQLQRQMLVAAARCVADGGTLVYSTCTISEVENEQQIEAFLQSHPDFRLDSAAGATPGSPDAASESRGLTPASAGVTAPPVGATPPPAGATPGSAGPGAIIKTMPHTDATAGFFIARMRRG